MFLRSKTILSLSSLYEMYRFEFIAGLDLPDLQVTLKLYFFLV